MWCVSVWVSVSLWYANLAYVCVRMCVFASLYWITLDECLVISRIAFSDNFVQIHRPFAYCVRCARECFPRNSWHNRLGEIYSQMASGKTPKVLIQTPNFSTHTDTAAFVQILRRKNADGEERRRNDGGDDDKRSEIKRKLCHHISLSVESILFDRDTAIVYDLRVCLSLSLSPYLCA